MGLPPIPPTLPQSLYYLAGVWTQPQTMRRNGIGVTQTDGLVLENATAAAAGAQQRSPALRLTAQGWKTNATAASQTVDWLVDVLPVQGAAAPTANLVMAARINGAAYADKAAVTSGGAVLSGGTFAFLLDTDTGLTNFENGNNNLALVSGGSTALLLNTSTFVIRSTMPYSWSTAPGGAGEDLYLWRDAADVLALYRTTNAQAFRLYNTRTDASNYERGFIGWISNRFEIISQEAGTGVLRPIRIYAGSGGGQIRLNETGGGNPILIGIEDVATYWTMDTSGHFLPWTNNTHDFGATGTRVRTGYFGTSVVAPRLITPMTSELTIAAGVITVTGGYHRVDTQSDDASDDLDTINGGTDGALLVLRAENAARTVVVKDGTGNIQCAGDMSLDNTQDSIILIYDATLTAWLELSRSDNGA